MNRPRMICHMMTALDGRITGPYLYDKHTQRAIEEYDRIHESFGARAWMCGRKTMEENFTLGAEPVLPEVVTPVPRTDYLAKPDAKVFCLAVDPSGKLGWPASYIEAYSGRSEAHIVEILTERVSDGYLQFLQNMGISYLFAGKEGLNQELLLQKVKEKLGVELLLLEGGGSLNGSFLESGMIDELSLVLAPLADGCTGMPALFDRNTAKETSRVMCFALKSVEQIGDNELWVRYEVIK